MRSSSADWRSEDLTWLHRLARRLASSDADADDLVQSTVIASGSMTPTRRPWLGGVLRNRWRMWSRGARRRSDRLRDELDRRWGGGRPQWQLAVAALPSKVGFAMVSTLKVGLTGSAIVLALAGTWLIVRSHDAAPTAVDDRKAASAPAQSIAAAGIGDEDDHDRDAAREAWASKLAAIRASRRDRLGDDEPAPSAVKPKAAFSADELECVRESIYTFDFAPPEKALSDEFDFMLDLDERTISAGNQLGLEELPAALQKDPRLLDELPSMIAETPGLAEGLREMFAEDPSLAQKYPDVAAKLAEQDG